VAFTIKWTTLQACNLASQSRKYSSREHKVNGFNRTDGVDLRVPRAADRRPVKSWRAVVASLELGCEALARYFTSAGLEA
jgi:hypothetical protein